MAKVWFATLGFAAAGAATVFLLSEVPMQKYTDDAYALEEKPGRGPGRGEVEMGLGMERDSEERVAMKSADSAVTENI